MVYKRATVLLNQIRTIDKRRIVKKLGSLDIFLMNKMDLAIKICLALDWLLILVKTCLFNRLKKHCALAELSLRRHSLLIFSFLLWQILIWLHLYRTFYMSGEVHHRICTLNGLRILRRLLLSFSFPCYYSLLILLTLLSMAQRSLASLFLIKTLFLI